MQKNIAQISVHKRRPIAHANTKAAFAEERSLYS